MKGGAAVPENLRVQHNRQPGQRHPIGSGCGGKGPGNGLAVEPCLYIWIFRYEFDVIGEGEFAQPNLFKSDKGEQGQCQVNQKDMQFFGCLFHQGENNLELIILREIS